MPGTVVGVASENDIIMLDGEGPASELLAVLAERGVAGKQLHVFGDCTTVAISRENLHDEDRLREALHMRLSGRARLIDGLGAVSVVGAGINATYANVRAGMQTLESLSIAPAGVATSSFRITWMIPRERIADAVRALHAKFIESQRPLLPAD
jgi:aspartate kinase